MTESHPPTPPVPPPPTSRAAQLVDGDWHQMHRLTPWLNLGAAVGVGLIIIGSMFVSVIAAILEDDLVLGVGLLVLAVILVLLVIGGVAALVVFLDHRNRRFRLTDELFELRSGIIGKNHRQVRLDRLQSVNLNRPLFPRLLGLTQLETSGAGKDSDIKLSYLGVAEAEFLRAEILRRASGARRRQQETTSSPETSAREPLQAPGSTPTPTAGPTRRGLGDYIDAALSDLASPGVPGGGVPGQAVLGVPPARIAGATFLSAVLGLVVVFVPLVLIAAPVAAGVLVSQGIVDVSFAVLGAVLAALGAFVVALAFSALGAVLTLPAMMNYTIAGTPDGVQIGRGLLSQTSDTVPPGRIHCVQVHQSLLWRPFGWYQIKIDRADLQHVTTTDSNQQAALQQRQVVLPVGKWDDVQRVLALVLPMHMGPHTAEVLSAGMQPGPHPGFAGAPRSAKWLHPFTWRRLGYVVDEGLVYLRRGFLTRKVSIVPAERMQSVTLHDGPLRRSLGLVSLWINTVGNAVSTRLPGVDAASSVGLFDRLRSLAVERAALDTSHRWNEARARSMLASARIAVDEAHRRGEAPPAEAQRMLDAEAAWHRDNPSA